MTEGRAKRPPFFFVRIARQVSLYGQVSLTETGRARSRNCAVRSLLGPAARTDPQRPDRCRRAARGARPHPRRARVAADRQTRIACWCGRWPSCRRATIPARCSDGILPGGAGAEIWTFFTYALLHADWMHLGFNAVWLLAFGSPVARRFGMPRFLAVLRRDGCGRRGGASAGPCRRAGADDRRVGRDLRHDGGGDALCFRARRLARHVARRPRRRRPGAGGAAAGRAAQSARARISSACGSASICCSASARFRF